MFGLPDKTSLKKQLPKTAIYRKFNLNNSQKEQFDADISRITIINEISPRSVNIEAGKEVSAFFVVHLLLKKLNFDSKNIELITKLIDQNMLLVLEYENKACLAVWRTKLITSEWKNINEITVPVSELNLDAVWDNIIMQIGNIKISDGNTLDEQIKVDSEREKILKQIAKLEKQARAEKQPKKKYELVNRIKELNKEIFNYEK